MEGEAAYMKCDQDSLTLSQIISEFSPGCPRVKKFSPTAQPNKYPYSGFKENSNDSQYIRWLGQPRGHSISSM
jgi:hypothetical protein